MKPFRVKYLLKVISTKEIKPPNLLKFPSSLIHCFMNNYPRSFPELCLGHLLPYYLTANLILR